MLTNLLFLRIVLSFFMFMLLYIEWRRTREFKLRILFIGFLAMFAKELYYAYYLFNILFDEGVVASLQKVEELKGLSSDFINNISLIKDTEGWTVPLQGRFVKFSFYWNLTQAVFYGVFFHMMHSWAHLNEQARTRLLAGILNLLLTVGAVFAFYTIGEAGGMANADFTLLNWGMTLWQLGLLGFTALVVSKVYRYTLLDLKYLVSGKPTFVTAIITLMLFMLLSRFFNPFMYPNLFVFQTFAVIALAVFAYKFFLYRMDETEQKVMEIENEKELVIRLLQDIGHSMADNLSQELVLERIIEAATKATDARSGAVLLIDEMSGKLNVEYVYGFYPPVHKLDIDGSMIKEKFLVDKFKNSKIKVGDSYLGQVAENGEPLLIQEALKDERIEQTSGGLMDIRSVIVVPLKIQDDILGVMSILNKESALFFSEADLSLMETLADQAAITLNQVKLYQEMLDKKQAEKELNVAGDIQQSLLPSEFPEMDSIDIFAFSHPAKGVGGDYYDLLDFGNGKVGITVTDVAGKGVPAALVMVMIRSVLRTFARADKEAKDVVSTVNTGISGEVTTERYATMFYFVYDSEYKILNYCNGGHGPLLLYRSNLDSFALLDTEGMPVGIVADVEYGQEYTSLHAGDIAVLYTDGITECMNLEREQWGVERLKQTIRDNKELSAKELSDTIYKLMKEFAGGAPQHDDETLLLMKAK